MDTLVSIIVPAYNAGRYLSETVGSVSNQTLTEWELLIVDDGSTDNTLALAQQFADSDGRIRCLHQENAGVSAARNTALMATNPLTKYVAFLDADDMWDPDALELMVGMLETDPEAVGTHGLAREIDSAGNSIEGSQREAWGRNRHYIEGRKLLKKELNEPTTFSSVVYDPCFLPSASMVRHSALERVGLFDTSLHYAEDQDMWLRISRLGHLIFINRALCSYRKHDASAMSKGNERDLARRTYVRERMISSPDVSPEQKVLLRRGVAFWYRYLAMQKFEWMTASLRDRKLLLAVINMRHAVQNFFKYLVLIR